MISIEMFNKFIRPGLEKNIAIAKKYNKKVMLHSCGSVANLIPYFIDMGVDALHPLQAKAAMMSAEDLSREFKGKISFLGGIEALNNVMMIEEIVDTAGDYSTGIDSFFRSSSLFFVVLFWHYAIIALFLFFKNSDSIIAKASLIMIIVLNLNYGVDHNYTRILTLFFPFYSLLLIETITLAKTKSIQIAKFVLVFFCFIVNVRLFYGRVGSGTYLTSFMDGSLLNLFFYPSFLYLY